MIPGFSHPRHHTSKRNSIPALLKFQTRAFAPPPPNLLPTRLSRPFSKFRSSFRDEVVVGIDLGTTNSALAIVKDGQPVIVPSEEGLPITPSVVSFRDDGEILVGAQAKREAVLAPETTFFSIKRFIGRSYKSVVNEAQRVPYKVVPGPDGEVLLECPYVEGNLITPEQISSLVLENMLECAQKSLRARISKAVISVPAYFDEQQKEATIAAGLLAGLEKVRLIQEPVASALAYGLDVQQEQTVLVFDLGGGTFDVSILEVGGGVIEVLATGGDAHLGGDDWDAVLVDWLVENSFKPHKIEWKNPKMMANLKALAEYAKMKLSSGDKVGLKLPIAGGVKVVLRQNQFEEMSGDLYRRAREAVNQCCWRAGIDLVEVMDKQERAVKKSEEAVSIKPKRRDPVSEVLLVGGATKMPSLKKFVRNMTGIEPRPQNIDPDKAVALGAAIQAGVLQGEVENVMLMDVWQASLMRAMAMHRLEGGEFPPENEEMDSSFEEDEIELTDDQDDEFHHAHPKDSFDEGLEEDFRM